jgi:hypothetical protein
MNINLHIERLILDGVNITPNQRQLLQTSVETELTRLLTEGRIASSLAQGTTLPRLSTSGIHITGNNPLQLGQQIAQSVYGGIGHEQN